MKKLFFAVLIMFGTAILVNAQELRKDTAASQVGVTSEPSGERTKIKTEQLPEAVKQTLEDQEYKGWLINAAFHDAKKEEFEVELKNGTESQTVRFSKEGQRIDD